jgi:photosystem II stability/assembly factor-like uncharacterized protein
MRNKKACVIGWLIVGLAAMSIDANPILTPGTWVNISPAGGGLSFATGANLTAGMTLDPSNPNTLYACICAVGASGSYPKGIYKSIDAGSTWTHLHAFDSPSHLRVDPQHSQHLYVTDCVAGGTNGFYVSHDGGATWAIPQGFKDCATSSGYFIYDCYSVDVDPTDFNHLLVTSHAAWKWGDPVVHQDAGVLESKDGGDTWIVHMPVNGWGTGHCAYFLSNTSLGIGNSNTWLLGTQGDGHWRTTDAGANWSKVSDNSMTHGGGQIYYAMNGVLYASGSPKPMRSTDNGATWTMLPPSGGFLSIYGDGTTLYTLFQGGGVFQTSPESDGLAWNNMNQQLFSYGPYEMVLDPKNGILYAACQFAGVWALKVPVSSTSITTHQAAQPSEHMKNNVRIESKSPESIRGMAFDIRGKMVDKESASRQAIVIRGN